MFKKPQSPSEFNRLKKKKREEENVPNGKSIPTSIDIVKLKLGEVFSECSDFTTRECVFKVDEIELIALVAFIDELINIDILDRDIIKPLKNMSVSKDGSIPKAIKQRINTSNIKEVYDFDNAVDDILSGSAVIFVEGEKAALKSSIKNPEARAIKEPDTEVNIRGPREGFIEKIDTNILLIRRRVRHPNFKVETLKIGSKTKTEVAVCYIKGIASEQIINEVRTRLNKIKTDAVLAAGYIEQFIDDQPFSLFPLVGNSEKPDKVVANLLEGRVGIVVDGTPFVLTVPYLFIECFQTTEDYYEKPFFPSFLRAFRIFNLFTATTLPALYVAFSAFHQNVIPFQLLLTMMSSREGIPFSPFVEAVAMILTFELIREASVRMPRPIGQTIGIIGAVVLGEAAVAAGIASAPLIVVVSITALATFLAPPLARPIGLIRLIALAMANIIGLYGIGVVLVGISIHLCKLRSFGIPYLYPFSPLDLTALKDTALRFPLWSLTKRPKAIIWGNDEVEYRMEPDMKDDNI